MEHNKIMEVICISCLREMTKCVAGFDVTNYPKDREYVVVQSGDLFECRGCGIKVYSSFGNRHEIKNNERVVYVDQKT